MDQETGRTSLTAQSSFTGGTTIEAGTLVLSNASGAAYTYTGGEITIGNAATLQVTGNHQYWFANKTFSFGASGGGTLESGLNLVIDGTGGTIKTTGGSRNVVHGSGGFNLNSKTLTFDVARGTDSSSDLVATAPLWNGGSIAKNGSGILSLTGSSSYTGETFINAGTLIAANNSALGTGGFSSTTKTTVSDGATLALQGNISVDEHAHIYGNGVRGLRAIRNLSGNNALTSTGYALRSNATVGVDAGSLSVTQFYEEGGSFGLTKVGAGTLTLTASSNYTGATTVSAGKLVINGNQSAATGAVTVAAGAALGGSGTVGGATTIAGSHTPGNSPGVQTFASDLTYLGGSSVQWELAANSVSNSSVVFDQILVGGNLTFSGSTALSLAFNGAGSLVDWRDTAFWGTDRSWLIYDVTGTTTGFANLLLLTENWADASGDLFAQYLPNASFKLEQQGSDVYLTFQAVPEPSTVVLVGIGLVGLVLVRRRRQ